LKNTLEVLKPNETEAVEIVHHSELSAKKVEENAKAKIKRDAYPFSICVDGMASR